MNTTIVVGALSALIAMLGGVIVALIASRTNRTANAINWSKELLARLTAVEKEIVDLKAQLTTSQRALQAAIRFIDRLVDWGRSGGREAMPNPPESLHDYLDQDLWATHGPPHETKVMSED